jgi:hypothetical protein
MFHVKQFLFLFLFLPFFTVAQHFGTTTLPLKALPAPPPKNASIVSFLESFPEYNSLNAAQKDWFYWTSYSRSNPKSFWDSVVAPILVNFPTLKTPNTISLKEDLYKATSLPLVKPNSTLLKTAQSFANEMASKNASPSHTSPSGSTFPDRMKAAGIINCAGENISFGPSDPVLMLVLLYIDEGVANVGHRKTLLNPTFIEMGIGLAKYPNNNTIVIQDFGCKQTK